MKLLVLTDFSPLSGVAVRYATQLAKKMQAELLLLHVVLVKLPPRANLNEKFLEERQVTEARQQCRQIKENILGEDIIELDVSCHVVRGYSFENTVETFAGMHRIDFIVMGTRGTSGPKKLLVGRSAAAVIRYSSIPVIAVPASARFNEIRNIVYATDRKDFDRELHQVLPFARRFDATLHVLYVAEPSAERAELPIDTRTVTDRLANQLQYPHVLFRRTENRDIVRSIDDYLTESKADMLLIFPHQPAFFEKILGKSTTRQLAFHSLVPMVTIRKE